MSGWTHPVCDACWFERNPGQAPVRIIEKYRETELCCFCLMTTRSGMYLRADPADTRCKGEHGRGKSGS